MRLLRLTPWRRGPRLLVRRPGVALALLAAAMVAALPAAAAPLFLSSAQHATLHRQVGETCLWRVGAQFTGPAAPANPLSFRIELGPDSVVGAARYHQRRAVLEADPVAGLTGPVSAGYADLDAEPVERPLPLPDLSGVRLLTRDGFQDHVEVLAGPVGEGLWLPHEHARAQGLEVGDELRLSARSGDPGWWSPPERPNVAERALERGQGDPGPEPEPVTLPVAAIYRDLRTLPESQFWCGVEDGYLGTQSERSDPNRSILPMVLVDTGTFLSVGEATRSQARQWVGLALTDPELTAPEAARLAADVAALRQRMFGEHPELFPTGNFSDDTEFQSFLDRYQRRAALVRTGLLPPVLPITAAGTVVGLVVAAAAGVFWVQRRRQELAVLAAHGVGAAGLGVKAVAEALPAVAAGAAAGWGTAWATFSPQVWVSGDPDRTRTEITDAALPLSRVATIDQQRTGAVYEPVTYTFQYLIALSIFTGLIGAVGLLLYLESRTTAHRRAYVMLRRLGLSPGAHRRSMLLEVGAPVLVGLGAGLGAAVALAFSLRDGFDVDRRLFPGALLDLPTTMTAAVSAAAVVVAVAASLLAHARVTRANPAEVLRDTA